MNNLKQVNEWASSYKENLEFVEKALLDIEAATTRVRSACEALPHSIDNIQKAATAFNDMADTFKKIKSFFSKGTISDSLTEIGSDASGIFNGIDNAATNTSTKMSGFCIVMSKVSGAMSKIMSPAGLVVGALALLAGAFAYLMTTNDGFRESVMTLFEQVGTAFMPILQMITTAFMPVLEQIMSMVQGFMPLVSNVLLAVVTVISNIMTAIAPIVEFVAGIIVGIIAVLVACGTKISEIFTSVYTVVSTIWTNIKTFIVNAITAIAGIIRTLTGIISTVFNTIFNTVKSVMDRVGNVMKTIFASVKTAWGGLTSFVGGVFSGIAGAFNSVTGRVKSVVNTVIRSINRAIGVINMIPGVSISRIAQLYHGTDNWQGGFAYMNEGGRGELTYLPNGAQVIPHDISVKYAKEAARANAGGTVAAIDYDYLIDGLARAMSNVQVRHTSVINGKEVANQVTPLVNRNLGSMRRLAERGVY